MKKVLCVGSAVVDVLVQSNDFRVLKSHQVAGGVALAEVYGGKTEASNISFQTGGAGTNVAVALTRLGVVTSTISRVGDDLMKDLIFNDLLVEGVDTSMVQTGKGEKTGISVVLIAVDGSRSIVTYRGASKNVESSQIPWDKVGNSDWIQIAALGGNMSLVEDLVSFAREKKIPVGWNPGKGELKLRERMMRIMPKIDLLVLNRMEAAILLHHSYEEAKQMAEKISALGARRVAITDGVRGAGLLDENTWISAGAFRTKSVDDTGAGDAFVAGVVAGILSDKDSITSLKMGMANGASEVRQVGAKSGLLRKKEMTKWLRKRLKIVEEKVTR